MHQDQNTVGEIRIFIIGDVSQTNDRQCIRDQCCKNGHDQKDHFETVDIRPTTSLKWKDFDQGMKSPPSVNYCAE